MQKIISIANLIKLPYLFVIVAAEYAMRYGIMEPMLTINGFSLQISSAQFFLLVLASVLIAAGGFIIYAYNDIQRQRRNQPGKLIIDKHISQKTAFTAYIAITAAGIGIGIYLSWVTELYIFGKAFAIIASVIWFYSSIFKLYAGISTLVLALICSFIPVFIGITEIPLLNAAYQKTLIKYDHSFLPIMHWLLGYGIFSFLIISLHDISKDIQEFFTNPIIKRRTIPTIYGLKPSKIILISILCLLLSALLYVFLMYFKDKLSLFYISTTLFIPGLILIYIITKGSKKQHFQIVQIFNIILLLGGLGFTLIVRNIILTKF